MIFRKNSSIHFSDEEIIARFRQSGNAAVLGTIFDRYSKLVFGLCMKYLKNRTHAEDETMAIFEKLITDLQRHNVDCFKAWLYTYSKNHCLMELRRKKPGIIEFDQHIQTGKQEDYEEKIKEEREKESLVKQLEKLINYLKPEQQQCIRLFYLENHSYRDVSEQTGLSLKQVKTNIQNGKRNLRTHFEKNNTHRI